MTNIIDGRPSKKFFIDMITRDISIEDAIVDLLDNCVDGASRASKLKNLPDFTSFTIDIVARGDRFEILDNCGGFSLEAATTYAFRMGKPEDISSEINNSVGRFGIGMKRSLFKLGKKFEVESQHGNDHFRVRVDVGAWDRKEGWEFEYEIVPPSQKLKEDGTKVSITELREDVKTQIADPHYHTDLEAIIGRLLNFSLSKGLQINLNAKKVASAKVELLMSDEVIPYVIKGEHDGVSYKLIAGLGEVGDPSLSGWYIYCNDRLVLEADRSSITGWDVQGVKKWHPSLVMFRGIVFFDSAETSKLPITTTKKGIDATSSIYQFVFPMMLDAMNNIIPFLNKVATELPDANEYRQRLGETLSKYSSVSLKSYDFSHCKQAYFHKPILNVEALNRKQERRISYSVSAELAEEVKRHAKVRSYKDLGLKTFDYYIRMEGIDDEER